MDFINRLQARGVDASMELLDGVTHYKTTRFAERGCAALCRGFAINGSDKMVLTRIHCFKESP